MLWHFMVKCDTCKYTHWTDFTSLLQKTVSNGVPMSLCFTNNEIYVDIYLRIIIAQLSTKQQGIYVNILFFIFFHHFFEVKLINIILIFVSKMIKP